MDSGEPLSSSSGLLQLVMRLWSRFAPHGRVLVYMQLGIVEKLMIRVEVEVRLNWLFILWFILTFRQWHT